MSFMRKSPKAEVIVFAAILAGFLGLVYFII